MKNKFEAAMMLKKGSKTLTGRYLIAIEQAAEICDTLHQQAMKEKLKEVLKLIDEAIEKSRDYTCSYDYLCDRFYDIAKENNIEL